MKYKPLPDEPLGEVAGSEDALDFVRGLQKRRDDDEAVKRYIDEFPIDRLQSIGRRIMMDLLKGLSG